jgi:hypothetical protein
MKIDNEMKMLQKELKQRRALKKNLSSKLVDIMKTNEIDCFDMANGKLIYTKNNVKSALSKKHLEECLSQYFAQRPDINPGEITEFILDKRVIKVNEGIRHKV